MHLYNTYPNFLSAFQVNTEPTVQQLFSLLSFYIHTSNAFNILSCHFDSSTVEDFRKSATVAHIYNNIKFLI